MRDCAKEQNGLPLGSKFVGVASPKKDQWYIALDGSPCPCRSSSDFAINIHRVVVEFTHGYGQCPLEDVPIPADEKLLGGSVATAWGVPKEGDRWLTTDGLWCANGAGFMTTPRLRLEPKPATQTVLRTADQRVRRHALNTLEISESDARRLVTAWPELYSIVEVPK